MNEQMRIEYNYEENDGNVNQVWFSLDKYNITRFDSFDEFLRFVYAMEEMAETIAEEMGIDIMAQDDDLDDDFQSFTTNIKKFLN